MKLTYIIKFTDEKSFCKGCITLYGIENGILASGKYDVVMTVPRAQYEKRGLLATMGQV